MSDQRPDTGDPTEPTSPSTPEEIDAEGQPADTAGDDPLSDDAASSSEGETVDGVADEDEAGLDEGPSETPEVDGIDASAEDEDPGERPLDGEAPLGGEELEPAAEGEAPGAAWTTTPVPPDPDATEAALAALAAKPEPGEPPEEPLEPIGEPEEAPEEGMPVLLVGGILVAVFIVVLAIVLVLFRPFDGGPGADATLSPSPTVSASPLPSPSAEAIIDMPDFQGLSLQEAEETADQFGLVVRANPVETDDFAPDTVVDQQPPPGDAIATGTTIDLFVARPLPTRSVPDVVGMPEDEAVAEIEDAGLAVGDRGELASDDVEAGDVVSTDPAAATEVAQGTEVDLIISTGPEPVAVPDITDLSEDDFLDALADAGLEPGERTEAPSDEVQTGNVISTDPAAGDEIAPGSTVDYVVSTGPEPVAVPDITDLDEDDFLDALADAGLEPGERTEAPSDEIQAGNIISTEPVAGSEVAPGSTVDYVISAGPELVSVPDVVGMPEDEAITEIEDAGLAVGERTEVLSDEIAAGEVVSTDPAAAAEVANATAIDYVVSAGPELVSVPDVVGMPEDEAVEELEDAGLAMGDRSETFNDEVAAGSVISTDPAAGSEVAQGTSIYLAVSAGPEPVAVPELTGLSAAEAEQALAEAGLALGEVSELDDAAPAGTVLAQDPAAGGEVAPGSAVGLSVSAGPGVEPRGEGGDLESPTVISRLDEIAAGVVEARELPIGNTPYDGANQNQQRRLLAERAGIVHDISTLDAEDAALTRLGLLAEGDDLEALLSELYGQALPVTYLEVDGRISVLNNLDDLNVPQRGLAAREFGRAALDQSFGLEVVRSGDGDQALAGIALEQGDATSAMLGWAAENVSSGNQSKIENVVVPGNAGVLSSMPEILQREYTFPYVEGQEFVERLRSDGGWDAVNAAWSDPPVSTEQILHPNRYPDDSPTEVSLDGLADALGSGWSESWQETMGELRIAVWAGDDAASRWAGDGLVSLDGPDGSWAIVWQTAWDRGQDAGRFTSGASDVTSGLPGAHAVLEADLTGGIDNPVLVLLTSDADTLSAVRSALGVGG